jgi:hypothetical protein
METNARQDACSKLHVSANADYPVSLPRDAVDLPCDRIGECRVEGGKSGRRKIDSIAPIANQAIEPSE